MGLGRGLFGYRSCAVLCSNCATASISLASFLRERSEEAAELERRAANLESQWTDMKTKVTTRDRTATVGLREEVEEDMKNARAGVADLKSTDGQRRNRRR